MPNADDIRWFKENFQDQIEEAVRATPFDVDMIAALACQETGEVWPILQRKGMDVDEILSLCVGDTIDAPSRGAFPTNKADLLKAPRGQEMFEVAREALVGMAEHIASYRGAASNPAKFCHGFGMFQRDLQFFRVDPDYFLDRRWADFAQTLGQCLTELRRGLKKRGFEDREELSDLEFATVAIVYNTGRFDPKRGLQQGFRSSDGRFYGEQVFDFVRLARTVATSGGAPAIQPAPPGQAILPPPTPPAGPADFQVDTQESMLRLRSEPRISDPPTKNVVGHLPDGQLVHAVTGEPVNRTWLEVEASVAGALLRGFASTKFLVPLAAPVAVPVVVPASAPLLDHNEAAGAVAVEGSPIPAVFMPRKDGVVTKRTAPAGAHSLNEDGQPAREGSTAAELVASIARIVDWLGVDRPANKRYQPRAGLTFCNIYAHDFCFLAGVYLPRVWWTPRALLDIAAGRRIEPLIGDTITELRANDLFRWLRDFGPGFGWRQTGTLDKLQQGANQGAIGLIVARRREDGKSGHIVVVVPEMTDVPARRNAAGEVIAPVQSQAGAANFRRGTGRLGWFRDAQFAESAFYIHA